MKISGENMKISGEILKNFLEIYTEYWLPKLQNVFRTPKNCITFLEISRNFSCIHDFFRKFSCFHMFCERFFLDFPIMNDT